MQLRHVMLTMSAFWLAGAAARAQQPGAQAPAEAPGVIRTETRLVLVDTVVVDKKGTYVHDLTIKDFHVWEDNKEQSIKSFSFEADPNAPSNSQKRYLVLFFDNSTMEAGDQIRARDAAAKFIDSNAGPNRLMAIVNFGGSIRIAQNFTADAERLKQVVKGVKFSAVAPNAQPASIGFPTLGNAESDFGVRSVLLALRSMAKNLAPVSGRKSLIMFTSGFVLNDENRPELTATIDACNKSNVAIYPIDVRGLVASVSMGPVTGITSPSGLPSPRLLRATVSYTTGSFGNSFLPQHGGGGGGGGAGGGGGHGGGAGGGAGGGTGGGAGGGKGGSGGGSGGSGGKGGSSGGSSGGGRGSSGGSSGGTRGGGGPTTMNPYAMNPYNMPRQIVPAFPETASTNQQVLYMLADGTGGFVIVNTNDLLGGLEKIGREQNEYYVLGYAPTDSPEGSCHTLKVKVERSGTTVRARSGYCNARPKDLLAGDPSEKELETRASASQAGTVSASMQVPFFYTGPSTARVDVAMEIAPDAVKFEKTKGKFHSTVNVLGIAYRQDGSVGARFSDAIKLDLQNKKELETFKERPIYYENQFEVAPGTYNLKVVFSTGGEGFGKVETPLTIDPYDGKQFGLSAMALSKEVHRLADVTTGLDAELLEGKTPLVTQGMQVTPSGSNRFKKTDISAVYAEVYEPLLTGPNPPIVAVQLRVLDRKSGEQKQDSGLINVGGSARKDNAMIPVGLKLQVDSLTAGAYRAELKAVDSVGHASPVRLADFDVE